VHALRLIFHAIKRVGWCPVALENKAMALEHFESMCVHLLHADRVREWQRLMASTIFT